MEIYDAIAFAWMRGGALGKAHRLEDSVRGIYQYQAYVSYVAGNSIQNLFIE